MNSISGSDVIFLFMDLTNVNYIVKSVLSDRNFVPGATWIKLN